MARLSNCCPRTSRVALHQATLPWHGSSGRASHAWGTHPKLPSRLDGQGGLDKRGYCVHFVTAREMVNIALAACDGNSGNPGKYRDYRFQLNRAHTGNESLFLTSTRGRRDLDSN